MTSLLHALAFVRRLAPLAVLAMLLPACSPDDLTGTESNAATPAAAQTLSDVSGTWEWSEVTVIKARPFAAEVLFGVTPEGPITHLSCPTSGLLTIAQNGSMFSGSSTQASALCTTRGGQTGQPPFPPSLDLVDGEIRGRSFRFTFVAGGVPGEDDIPCSYQGALRVESGQAVEMHGSGDCAIPKAFGNDKILHFTATRP